MQKTTLDTMKKMDKGALAALCADAITKLGRACEKFPTFPGELTNGDRQHIRWQLNNSRLLNDTAGGERATGHSVFGEEYYELQEAVVITCDLPAARKELVQSLAMLLRIAVHLDDYVAAARKARDA